MKITSEKPNLRARLSAWYVLCPVAHTAALVSLALIALFVAVRSNGALMARISKGVVRPIHGFLSRLTAHVPFSVAELIIALLVAAVLARIVIALLRLARGKASGRGAYRLAAQLLSLGVTVYAGYCLMWGVYYYGDDFLTQSGLTADPITTEELEAVTRYFADLSNEYGAEVTRNEAGLYVCDRAAVLARSASLYENTVDEFPCLAGADVAAKGMIASRVMSYIDFTGFFFPFTAEANVNTDFPPALFASTVAHELAHQRGVAKEQEANFVAVLASLRSHDADYRYSAALLAYTHLGNALHSADYAAWEEVYHSLDEAVRRDLSLNNAYWRQFDTPVQTVSNTVYEGFLQSYDQTLGMKSYGACVDLLVNYYYPRLENSPPLT